MYECELCDFSSDRSTDLSRHKKTKKHTINEYKNTKNINDDNKIIITDKILNCYQNGNKNTPNSKHSLKNGKNGNICDDIKDNQNAILSTTNVNEHKPKKKQNKCNCGKIFNHLSGLSRHKKSCNGKTTEKDDYISKLENKLMEMQNRIEKIEQTNTAISNNSNNSNIIISNDKICRDNTVNNIIHNKTINLFTYLNAHCNEVQPIKMLESDDITRILTSKELGKHLLEDVIVFQYSKYALNEFLGEFILKEFKKSDPKKQQFWITDVTRLKFVVRQALNQNEAIWHPDKKGICLTKYIITPILDEIFSMMSDYKNLCNERMKNSQTSEQREKIHEQSTNALKVIYEINQKELHKDILKYIAPYFQLELTELELIN